MPTETHHAIDAVWRLESSKLIAGLARMVRDVGWAEDLARAFLVPVPTVAQRIVRAKRILAEARVPFEVPPRAEFAERLSSVLAVVYLVFNEGYSATAGDDWVRRRCTVWSR